MKKRKIILWLLIIGLISSLSLMSCSDKSDKLNQTEISNEDELNIKEEEKELKVVDKEELNIEGEVLKVTQDIYYNNKGKLIFQSMARQLGEKDYFNEIKLENGILRGELYTRERSLENSKGYFFMEILEDRKAKIFNKFGDEGHIIDLELLKDESAYYYLYDDILIVKIPSIDDSRIIKAIKWYDLSNGTNKEIGLEDYTSFVKMEKYQNKLYISYSKEGLNAKYANRVMIVNLKTGEKEDDIKLDTIDYIIPLDGNRFLSQSCSSLNDGTKLENVKLTIYNQKSKEKINLMEWSKDNYWSVEIFAQAKSIITSPSGDKLVYKECKENEIYIKVAEIKGMQISEPITIYTTKKLSSNGALVCFSNDGKSVIISDSIDINKITKVEFNK